MSQGDDEEDPDGDELNVEGDDLELRLARLQYLLDRRPVPSPAFLLYLIASFLLFFIAAS